MSSRNSRQIKAPPTSSSPVSCPSLEEDELSNFPSPRHGRKESEHKRRIMMNQCYDELNVLLSMISERNLSKKMDKTTTLIETVNCIRVYYDLTQNKTKSEPPSIDPATPQVKSPTMKSPMSTSSISSSGSNHGPNNVLKTEDMLGFFLDSHDSFLMVVSDTGQILFTTEMVTSLLGHMQSRLVGQNIFNYVHDRDKPLIQSLFVPQDNVEGKALPNSSLIAYPARSFTVLFQLYTGETSCFPQFLPFKCLSYLRQWKHMERSNSPSFEGSPEKKSSKQQSCVVLIGKLPTSLTLADLAVGTNDVNFEFEMRVSREGRFIDIDKHAILLLGFSVAELIGTSFFDYIDPYHIVDVGESMAKFLNNGLGTTMPYRILTKGGRYVWVISKGYMSYDPWNNKPDHILLTNRVLGCDQVLPEHRFFRSQTHMPDLEGGECYTTAMFKQQAPAVPVTSLPSTKPNTAPPSIRIPSTFPPSPLLEKKMKSSQNSSAAGSYQNLPKGGMKGVDGSAPDANHRGRGVGMSVSHQLMQKNLEEKRMKLIEMQKELSEQKRQFEHDQMEFLKAAQNMMQQFPKNTESSPSLLSPGLSEGYIGMDPLGTSGEAPATPMSSQTAPPSVQSRGDSVCNDDELMWDIRGGGGGGGRGRLDNLIGNTASYYQPNTSPFHQSQISQQPQFTNAPTNPNHTSSASMKAPSTQGYRPTSLLPTCTPPSHPDANNPPFTTSHMMRTDASLDSILQCFSPDHHHQQTPSTAPSLSEQSSETYSPQQSVIYIVVIWNNSSTCFLSNTFIFFSFF